MKHCFLLIAFFCCCIRAAVAQNNYCDDLIRDTDKVKNTVTWHSPELNITLKSTLADTLVRVWVNFKVTHLSEFVLEDGGLFIRFDNGKTLKHFGQAISHQLISNRDGYVYQTDMLLRPDELWLFKTAKITKFQIAGIDVPVTDELAVQIEAYAICMSGMK